MPGDKVTPSVSFDPEVLDRVDEVAEEQGRSRSNLISRAVREYCDRHKHRKDRREREGEDEVVPA
jgi:metal-responsive CopG/Arc/MetJ family transcriptional regulator